MFITQWWVINPKVFTAKIYNSRSLGNLQLPNLVRPGTAVTSLTNIAHNSTQCALISYIAMQDNAVCLYWLLTIGWRRLFYEEMEIHFRLLINCLLWVSLHSSTLSSSQCLDLTTVIITASLSGHFVKKHKS